MAVHPLRPATDRRLGRPLPHQPANRTQAHPPAIACKQRPSFKSVPCGTDFVSGISTPFGVLSPAGGQVAYALLTRSPLGFCRNKIPVRLACVRHAASVQSEPESNSPVQICPRSLLGRNQNLKVVLFPFALRLSMNQARRRNGAKGRMPFCLRTVNSFLKIFQKALAKHWASFRRRRKLLFLRPLPVNNFFRFFRFPFRGSGAA